MQDGMQLLGRLTFPLSMFAYPFYLLNRSPGKEGSHYDPKTDLFSDIEGPMVRACCPSSDILALQLMYTHVVSVDQFPRCQGPVSVFAQQWQPT